MTVPNGYNTIPHFQYFEDIAGGLGSIGDVYYVDVNAGVDTNDGKSWQYAFKTLAAAIVASNASIAAGAAGWANRNRIFFKGDNDEAHKETLITLANKCDIIGVGSYDAKPYPVMIGNHVIGAGAYMGCRFINMGFKSLAAGGDIFTVPATTSGLAFIGCHFDGATAVPATGAIVATTIERLSIIGCDFVGAFSDAVIELAGTEFNSLMIADNIIQGGQQGIDVKATVTTSIRSGYILRNYINCVTEGINEASGKLYVHDNRVVTAAAKGVAGAGAIVAGAKMMLNNYISCSDVANAIVPANGSL